MSKRHPKTQFCIKGKALSPANRDISTKPKENKWQLTEDEEIVFYKNGQLNIMRISEGFVWDGASIPWAAWSILRLSPGGKCLLFSLWHDILYRSAGLTKQLGQEGVILTTSGKEKYTRWESDVLMRDIMVWHGIFTKVQYRLCYRMVHRFGKKHFGGPSPT